MEWSGACWCWDVVCAESCGLYCGLINIRERGCFGLVLLVNGLGNMGYWEMGFIQSRFSTHLYILLFVRLFDIQRSCLTTHVSVDQGQMLDEKDLNAQLTLLSQHNTTGRFWLC